MAKNTLDLKHYPIPLLDVGQSVLIGPYKEAKTAGAKVSQEKRADQDGMKGREFTQKQFLLVDPVSCETVKMYLIRRVT